MRSPKKTPPTTVRLYPELDEFVRAQAETHSKGQSGVINDAVAHYKQHVEQKKRKLFLSIAGEEA